MKRVIRSRSLPNAVMIIAVGAMTIADFATGDVSAWKAAAWGVAWILVLVSCFAKI